VTDRGDGTFEVSASTLAEEYAPLCAGERFSDQPTAAFCTGTLVGSDVLVTAGHCLDNMGQRTSFDDFYFVFDYAISAEGQNPTTFTSDQVYEGAEVLGLVNEEGTANDWAVVRLTRAVTGRTPVAVRTEGTVQAGQDVVAIGFGAGLPMKFSGNATVQAIIPFGFEANLDIVEGNSGGPVVDATTGMIEGVLSNDLAVADYNDNDGCFRATVCPDDPICEDGFTEMCAVTTDAFQAAIASAIQSAGGDTGDDTGDDDMTGDGTGDDTGNGDTTGDDAVTNDNDADANGVDDIDDFCLDTPAGAEVDEDGCEISTDAPAPGPCGALGLLPLPVLLIALPLMRRRA